MSISGKSKSTSLRTAFHSEGKSCREILSDSEVLDRIESEIRRGEEMIREAEELRKQGLALKNKAEADKRREMKIQEAIKKFRFEDKGFIEENGAGSDVKRLREGEISGKTYVVITGSNSEKQFQVFFRVN